MSESDSTPAGCSRYLWQQTLQASHILNPAIDSDQRLKNITLRRSFLPRLCIRPLACAANVAMKRFVGRAFRSLTIVKNIAAFPMFAEKHTGGDSSLFGGPWMNHHCLITPITLASGLQPTEGERWILEFTPARV